MSESFHPVLSCVESARFEKSLFSSDSDSWLAMSAVGEKLGRAIRFDFGMSRERQSSVSVLGLIGKGHNGGDALLAVAELARLDGFVGRVVLALVCSTSELKPNTRKALEQLEDIQQELSIVSLSDLEDILSKEDFSICIDGLLGMSFRPPLREKEAAAIELVNASSSIRCRFAVDLPSGAGDKSSGSSFRADFTYATGIYKTPLLVTKSAGVVRYLDIGFFDTVSNESSVRVITDRILDPLRRFRPAHSEKRQHGHLAILAGSRSMPGALAMSVEAALKSGVGLVTVFAPESIVAQLAVSLPEAMWRTWPETPEGGLALEGVWQIRSIAEKATALLLGPGMGSERETIALLQDIVSQWEKPILLDADALREEVVSKLCGPCVFTPHDGEFIRLTGGAEPSDENVLHWAKKLNGTIVKKGSSTRVSDGEQLFLNTTGNPVLSRGGSGDLLAGLTAGLLAQFPDQQRDVACMGAYWHGKAADLLARSRGQTAVRITELLDFLSSALEDGEVWNPPSPGPRPFGL